MDGDAIERYAEEHTTPAPQLLDELTEETARTVDAPLACLSGPLQGRFLETLLWASGARRVLEIGTFAGYAALFMAAALPPGGRLDTCELDERHAALARRYFERSPYADRIHLHLGPALETIAALEGDFDFVFVDADKPNYRNYYEAVLPRLSSRGLIAADNTLWGGAVLDPSDTSAETDAIRDFNEFVRADDRVTCVLLPIRDGLTLIRRAR
jgi:caffeoyl-CoA O-methyltransferase